MPIVQPTLKSFLRALPVYLLPGMVVSFLLSVLTHIREPQSQTYTDVLIAMIPAVLISPFIETFILIYPTSLAGQAQKNRWAASLIGATPLVALHFLNSWQSVVTVSWGFTWSAYCWLVLSETGANFWRRFAYVMGLHATGNFIAVSLGAIG